MLISTATKIMYKYYSEKTNVILNVKMKIISPDLIKLITKCA